MSSPHDDRVPQDLAEAVAGDATEAAAVLECLEVAAALGPNVILGEWLTACERLGLDCDPAVVEALITADLASSDGDVWRFDDPALVEALGRSALQGERWQRQRAACAQAIFEYHDVESPDVTARRATHLIEAGALENALEPLLVVEQLEYDRGDYARAESRLDDYEDILDSIEATDDDPRRGQSMWRRARLLHAQGAVDEAVELAEDAEDVLRDSQLYSERGQAALLLGRISRERGAPQRAREELRVALEHFGTAGDDRGIALSRAALGMLNLKRGQPRDAVRLFQNARTFFEAIEDSHMIASVLIYTAQAWHYLDDRLRAIECIEAAREVASRDGDVMNQAAAWNFEGEIARENADWGYAGRCYKQAAGLYSDVGSRNESIARFNMALTEIGAGRYASADEILAELEGEYAEIGFDGRLSLIYAARLATAAAAEDVEAVEEHLRQLSESLAETDIAHRDILDQLERTLQLLEGARHDGLVERIEAIADVQRDALAN